jgi:FkbM family methyltransferase
MKSNAVSRLAWRSRSALLRILPDAEPSFLDAHGQSFVAAIPSLPAGQCGNAALADYFFRLFERLRPTVFCDIGANRGDTALRAKNLSAACDVHGFEANPHIHGTFSAGVTAAGVHWHNLAVTAEDGPVEIFIPRELSRKYVKGKIVEGTVHEKADTGKSSLLQRDETATYDTVKVDGVALDSLFADRSAGDSFFLWIDVEGAAALVLEGARKTLSRTVAVLIEVEGHAFWKDHTMAVGIFETLLARGFEPVLRDREYDDAQFNVIFVRKNAMSAVDSAELSAFVAEASDTARAEAKVRARQMPRRLAARLLTSRRPNQQELNRVPVLIPCFNNPTHCERMLQQLAARGLTDVTFIDNASTDPDMIGWLGTCGDRARVVRLDVNLGPIKSIFTPERLAALPRYFCVTDPDLDLNPALPPDFLADLMQLTNRYGVGKAGFALDILHRADFHDRTYRIKDQDWKIWDWEELFWARSIGETDGGDRVFQASVDTTFALYDQRYFRIERFMRGLRVAGRFTARHLPWEKHSLLPKAEEERYRQSQKFSYYVV